MTLLQKTYSQGGGSRIWRNDDTKRPQEHQISQDVKVNKPTPESNRTKITGRRGGTSKKQERKRRLKEGTPSQSQEEISFSGIETMRAKVVKKRNTKRDGENKSTPPLVNHERPHEGI